MTRERKSYFVILHKSTHKSLDGALYCELHEAMIGLGLRAAEVNTDNYQVYRADVDLDHPLKP